MTNYATKGPATRSEDIVVSLKERTFRKQTADIKSKKMQESHRLDKVLHQQKRLTIGELCNKTGFPLNRVLAHVNYIIDKGIAKLETPVRRQLFLPLSDN